MQGFDEAERNRIIDNVRRLVDAKLDVSVALLTKFRAPKQVNIVGW